MKFKIKTKKTMQEGGKKTLLRYLLFTMLEKKK